MSNMDGYKINVSLSNMDGYKIITVQHGWISFRKKGHATGLKSLLTKHGFDHPYGYMCHSIVCPHCHSVFVNNQEPAENEGTPAKRAKPAKPQAA